MERDRLQALQQLVTEDYGTETLESEMPLRRLMNRIAATEANHISTGEVAPRRRIPAWLPYVSVAASLLLAVLFVGLLNPVKREPAEYRTLSNATDIQGVSHRIALTFEQPIKAKTVRAAFIETGSNIVSGPDNNGTYIVEIRIPSDMTDQSFIRSLRKIDGVRDAAFAGEAPNVAP